MSKMQPKILAFAGSLREGSYNHRLLTIAAEGAQGAGALVTMLRLADYPLPLFDEDDEREHGMPVPGQRLKHLFLEHHALLIASPEYNSSISGVLKNTIDWLSRGPKNEPSLAAFRGKVAGILSASPGKWGGQRGLVHLRSILGNMGVLMLPEQVCVSDAVNAFTESDTLRDEKLHQAVRNVGQRLAETTARLH